MAKRNDPHKLECILENIVAMADEGFSDITALTDAALLMLESKSAYKPASLETIAKLIGMIRSKAQDVDNLISCEAEEVGIAYEDNARLRRLDAIYGSREELKNQFSAESKRGEA